MRSLLFLAAAAMLAGSAPGVEAMPFAAPVGHDASQPALIRVADGCGLGRFRGVGGYCQGHRPIMVRKVCTVRGYPYAAVRRCRLVPIRR